MSDEQTQGNQSEVARLRKLIDEEQQAAQQGLYGLAHVSKHEFITARMERIGQIQEELEKIIGVEETARILVEQFEKGHEPRKGKDDAH